MLSAFAEVEVEIETADIAPSPTERVVRELKIGCLHMKFSCLPISLTIAQISQKGEESTYQTAARTKKAAVLVQPP